MRIFVTKNSIAYRTSRSEDTFIIWKFHINRSVNFGKYTDERNRVNNFIKGEKNEYTTITNSYDDNTVITGTLESNKSYTKQYTNVWLRQ